MSEQAYNPGGGNYELQQEYLTAEHARISANLFESGAASRLVASLTNRTGAVVNVDGLAQLDKLFLPSLLRVKRDRPVRQLSLAVVATSSGVNPGKNYSYFPLGELDDANILYPYPNVPSGDADLVHQAALELEQLKIDGILPNLDFNLLSINNPNTAITILPPSAESQ